jgi:RNA polymerase sigma-70 factor (ECF subfamily)
MSYFPAPGVPEPFAPFAALEQGLGFVPKLFRAQTLLPRVIEAEVEIAGAVLLKEGALTRTQKECILLAVAQGHANAYCTTAHAHVLRNLGMEEERVARLLADYHDAGLSSGDTALLEFALKLSQLPTWITRQDVDTLRGHGFADEAILEAVLVTALAGFLCTLSTGIGTTPDFPAVATGTPRRTAPAGPPTGGADPRAERYLPAVELSPGSFPPFAFFRDRFGFVPNIFRAQTLRPDVVEAESRVVGSVLLQDDVLPRTRKEYILLAVSAANLNTYCVAVHVEMLRNLGIPEDLSDQIAIDHQGSDLPAEDKALLDFAVKLVKRPGALSREDIEHLRGHGFTDARILEAVVMTGLSQFLNTVQMGLGVVPDFEPRLVFPRQEVKPPGGGARPIGGAAGAPGPEEDDRWVERARGGDLAAFEELVRRHHQRVYRTLIGITGSREEAEDALQEVFLSAFTNMGKFQGGAKFSTWLTRIAINEGVGRLRSRKREQSLDAVGDEGDEGYRPRQLRAWAEDAETQYSRAETRELVERAILGLPTKYRVAVLLRDIEQLSTAEAAEALGLPVPTLKTRLLRGRLMLRDALAPHYVRRA